MRIARIVVGIVATLATVLPATTAEASVTAFTDTAGTAWWTENGKTVVSFDDSVAAGRADAMRRAVQRTGGKALHEPGRLERHIAGGDLIGGLNGGRCALGFNARSGSTLYFLVAAHCVPAVGGTVYTLTGAVLGVVTAKDAGYDIALVRHTNTLTKPSAVNLGAAGLQPITSFGAGYVGQAVRRVGSTTGVRAGTITALNVTVNYAEGRVTGMIRTTICSEPGDSGGPMFANSIGIGITSGGSGNCTSGGVSYHSNVRRAATMWGVSTY